MSGGKTFGCNAFLSGIPYDYMSDGETSLGEMSAGVMSNMQSRVLPKLIRLRSLIHVFLKACTECRGTFIEVKPCSSNLDRHCLRKCPPSLLMSCDPHDYLC